MKFTPDDVREIFAIAASLLAGTSVVGTCIDVTPPGTTGPGDDMQYVYPTELDYEKRLGPSWADLNPGTPDRRPTLWVAKDKPAQSPDTFVRCNPFNVGREDGNLSDYWSSSGQVIYFSDKPAVSPGVDRIQTFAHYNGTFATSPRPDVASGQWQPDPFMVQTNYKTAIQPLGMVRNVATWQNDALIIWANGCLTCAGTQTSRDGSGWPLPFLQLPPQKQVTGAIAVTTSNEFAFIGVHDRKTGKGQIAVVALEGKNISFHTWPYMGLSNRGSFSDFKLLGYVDVSIAWPDSIAASTDGFWASPGQTQNYSLGQMLLDQLSKDGNGNTQNWTWGQGFASGLESKDPNWGGVLAQGGYLMASSKSEHKVVYVDLSKLMKYPVSAWIYDYENTAKNRGPAPSQWPQTFDVNPSVMPVQVAAFAVDTPTCCLAGQMMDRWTQDIYKAYVASEPGSVQIFDVSALRARWDWEHKSPQVALAGSFATGRNPIHMAFARFGQDNLPLIPVDSHPDPLNNLMWIAARGERELELAVSFGSEGKIVRQIQHSTINDVTHVSVADRANIVTVCDWQQGMIHSLRIGGLTSKSGDSYGPGENGDQFCEYDGDGYKVRCPIATSSCNVN